MEAPCEMEGTPAEDIGGPGAVWHCPLEMGVCTLCGGEQDLSWVAMVHELYGLWWVAKR